MPIYSIRGPDGRTYSIEGPAGASREQVIAKISERQGIGAPVKTGAQMAAEETGTLEAGLIGAGKVANDLVTGVQDLYYRATGDDESRTALQAEQESNRGAYDALRQAHPIATAVGESVPYVAGGLGTGAAMRGVGGLAANLGAQGATGATLGGLGYADTMAERGINAMVEGALGAGGEALGRVGARMMHPGVPKARGPAVDTVARGESAGYQALPSAGYDSKALRQTVEGGLQATPGGSYVMDAVHGGNQEIFNKSVTQAIGELDEPVLTAGVIDKAYRRIGGVFDDVLSADARIDLGGDDLLSRVVDIDDNQISYLIGKEDPLRAVVDRTYKMLEKGAVTGKELHAQQSKLGSAARAAINSPTVPSEVGLALFDLQHALLEAAEQSVGPQKAAALREARAQYRNLSNVVGGRAVNSVTGDVSAPKLAGVLERKDKLGYLRGQNKTPMYEGARFMGRFQRELPTSGTAERSWLGDALKYGAGGAIGGGATLDSPVEGAGAGLAAGIVAPNLLARAYLSPVMRKWLTSQASPLTQQTLRGLGIGGMQYGENQ